MFFRTFRLTIFIEMYQLMINNKILINKNYINNTITLIDNFRDTDSIN